MFRQALTLIRVARANSTKNPKVRELLTVAADAGNSDAQRVLGADYQMGTSGDVDYTQAKFWCEQAISQFDKLAPGYLGGMYSMGIGVPVDVKKALVLIALSAERGNEAAILELESVAQALDLSPADLKVAKEEAAKLECEYHCQSALFKGVRLKCASDLQ
jgi:uncharacterized protein